MVLASAAAELRELANQFPGYEFATQRTWDGIALVASRRGGCAGPCLYAVITDDPDEMRRALLEHEATQPAGKSRTHEEAGCVQRGPVGGQ